MKKTIFKLLLFALLTALFTVCEVSTSAAIPNSTVDCTGEAVEVNSFDQLKAALENYTMGQNIVLGKSIEINDNSKSYTINISGDSMVALDFNGYQMTVNSTSTKYLFNITDDSILYLLNGNKNKDSVVTFNTTQPSAALLRADNKFCEVYNLNVKYVMGDIYNAATDKSDTAVFSINKAYEVGIYGGVLTNEMTGGNGVVVSANSDNKTYLTFNIGGNAKIQSQKYCVNFDPSYIKSLAFGASKFEGSGDYERIKVPSTSSLTLNGLWPSPESGASTTVYCGGLVQTNKSKKITALSKADIRVDKTCEIIDNAEPFVVLRCAAGHIELCGVCKMAFSFIDPHDNKWVSGTQATCTTPGITGGYYCETCGYSTQKTTPLTGHSMTYNKGKADSCGVNGEKAHYYCSNCRSYYSDEAGTKKLDYNTEVLIKNNHKTEILPAVSATCTKEGLTQGKKCLTCNKTIVKQETVPKKGHSYPSEWTLVRRATCEQAGLKERICTSCKNTETQTIPKLSHSYNNKGKCIDCGKDKNDPEPEPEPENPGSSGGSSTVNCSCSCHKNGIVNFLFKIILFFQKIFRINQTCKGCGVAHY